ncbi:hypothetical protein F4801DRAFT_555255 [Xylaria longipes]|nr:hypothetical protein F4801DRAFT_555255 [Xylaria longipes]
MIRKRGTTRARRVPYSPDAFEDEIAMAAVAEEEKWKREQQERAARFKAKADKAKGGRGTGLPACSPGTYNNKKGYHPNQPSRSPKSRAQNKNSGGKGESKKGQAHMPKAKPARQNQQRHEQRSSDGGQQPRRAISSPDPFEGEIAMVTAAATGNTGSKGESKSQDRTPKTKAARQTQQCQTQQRQTQQQRKSQSSSGQEPRGRSARATPTVAAAQKRVPYSPDAFDDEIAMATAAEAEKWKREQAQATKVKVKAKATSIADRVEKTNGSSEESQYTKASGWTNEDGGNQVHNLIDL